MSEQNVQINRRRYSEHTLYANLFSEGVTEVQRTIAPVQRPQQQVDRPALAQRSYSSMSKKEQEAEKEKHQQLKLANTFVTAEDMDQPYIQHLLSEKKKVGGQKLTGREMIEKCLSGDCSQMEKMDAVLRNRAATLYMADFVRQYGEGFDPLDVIADFKTRTDPVSAMLNPLLRAGISLFIHSEIAEQAVVDKYRRLDELLNKEIMVATLTKNIADVPGDFSETQKWNNIRSQQFMIKSLLACHIGKFTQKNETTGRPSHAWRGSVANAFAHCSRVMYILPADDLYMKSKTMSTVDSLVGLAPFKTRGGATHNLQLKRKDGTREAKEKKSFTPFNQRGMNVAIGGLGNAGIPGPGGERRLLKNDGSCGHLYMHLERGDEHKNSGMLLGFESDAFMVRNQQGHRHDIFATAEKASSFGGQRADEIGDKYGGREVDLSEVTESGFTEVMDFVDALTEELLRHSDQQSRNWLEEIARSVSGDLMDRQALQRFFAKLKTMAQQYPLDVNYYEGKDFIGMLYGRQ